MDYYVEGLTEPQLADLLTMAAKDLEAAAAEQPGTEWHEACFAAFITLARESDRRKRRAN